MGCVPLFACGKHNRHTATHPLRCFPPSSSALLGGEGTARWRQRLREANRDKIIVFIGQAYGIFHLAEFAILTICLCVAFPPLWALTGILQRFGISLEPRSKRQIPSGKMLPSGMVPK